MQLYTTTRAPNPRRIDLFLMSHQSSYTQLGIEKIDISLADGQNISPAFLAVNPLGKLPALVLDNGAILADSVAICRYLEESYFGEHPSLFKGKTPTETAQIEAYCRQVDSEILMNYMYAFQLSHPFWQGRKEQLPESAPLFIRRAQHALAYFEQSVASKKYLVGNRVSMADISLFIALDFGRLVGVRVDETTPYLLSYYNHCKIQWPA